MAAAPALLFLAPLHLPIRGASMAIPQPWANLHVLATPSLLPGGPARLPQVRGRVAVVGLQAAALLVRAAPLPFVLRPMHKVILRAVIAIVWLGAPQLLRPAAPRLLALRPRGLRVREPDPAVVEGAAELLEAAAPVHLLLAPRDLPRLQLSVAVEGPRLAALVPVPAAPGLLDVRPHVLALVVAVPDDTAFASRTAFART
mmetsp:Transcript_17089/g.48858  ORF Transcript_17089/g.48858 Transcript_17089/m.48858 type:complete len:201 (-) Transcript_17089:269-871(-)